MSAEALEIVKYVCTKISLQEWSAIMFYKVNGSIRNPSEMSLEVVTIYPMHKGSGTFTEYEFQDKDFIKFRMENMHVNYLTIGHMHSHNNMASFFSGTDMEEILENSLNHNYYLSVIVNNRGEIVAKLAVATEIKAVSKQMRDENGDWFSIELPSEDEKIVSIFDCEVISNSFYTIPKNIMERTDKIITGNTDWEIRKRKELAERNASYQSQFPAKSFSNHHVNRIVQTPERTNFKEYNQSFQQKDILTQAYEPFEDDYEEDGDIILLDSLALNVLLLGDRETIEKVENTENAVAYIIHNHGQELLEYITKMVDNYDSIYKKFEITPNTVEQYLDDIDSLIGYFAQFVDDYPFMGIVVSTFEMFYEKCIEEFSKKENKNVKRTNAKV